MRGYCPRSEDLLAKAVAPDPASADGRHLAACPDCAAAARLSAALLGLAGADPDPSPLPDPGLLYQRALVARRLGWEAPSREDGLRAWSPLVGALAGSVLLLLAVLLGRLTGLPGAEALGAEPLWVLAGVATVLGLGVGASAALVWEEIV